MYCSYNWFRKLPVFKNKTATDFQKAFDFLGMEPVVVHSDAKLNHNLVVGQITALKPHPIKTQLTICQVQVNVNENYQVICGAKNLKVNMKIVFAKPKAILFNKKKISKANFAGVRSEGMICALYEVMPLQKITNKIIVLPEKAQIGDLEPLKYLNFDDVIWKLELTLGTRHLQNYFGLSHYLAQYWKLATAIDFDYLITQTQSLVIDNSLQRSLPKNELVLMVKRSPELQLPIELQTILQKLTDYKADFNSDLKTYIKLLSGCDISFAFAESNATYETLKWDPQKPLATEWMLIRIAKFDQINLLPPIFRIVAFHNLVKLYQTNKLPWTTKTELKLPKPTEIILNPLELSRVLGIDLKFETVKNLFDTKIWKISVLNQKWKFTIPFNQLINHPFQLIEEIVRLLNYDLISEQPLTANDLPNWHQLNSQIDLWIQIQEFFVNQNFYGVRIPFQIQKQTTNNYYNLVSSWLPELLKLVQKFQKPAFSIDTVWHKQDQNWIESQELLLMLPSIKPSHQSQIQFQYQAREYFLTIVRKIFQIFNLPLANLFYQPVVIDPLSPNQSIDLKIGYQTSSKTYDLIKIGAQINQNNRDSEARFPYLMINYDILTDLITNQIQKPSTFNSFQTQSTIEKTVSYFDLNLNFTTPINLFHHQKMSDQKVLRIDLIHTIKTMIQQTDKRILSVRALDFYQNNRITFRTYWSAKNSASKQKFQQKLITKVKNCLKVIKNVKI